MLIAIIVSEYSIPPVNGGGDADLTNSKTGNDSAVQN